MEEKNSGRSPIKNQEKENFKPKKKRNSFSLVSCEEEIFSSPNFLNYKLSVTAYSKYNILTDTHKEMLHEIASTFLLDGDNLKTDQETFQFIFSLSVVGDSKLLSNLFNLLVEKRYFG